MTTKEDLCMSLKEAERLSVMRQMDKQYLTPRKASEELGISLKQLRRIRQRYLEEGESGLLSKKKGQPSKNKISSQDRQKALDLLKTTYTAFGPTLASEKLAERDGVQVSSETLRKWMIEEGLWTANRKREQRVYQRRPRRSRFGELLQADGSPHDWFEGRGEKCCLIHFIDDATSKITGAKFLPTETGDGYLDCLYQHLIKYGIPLGLYTDKHSIFRVNKEEIKKGVGITHVGRILKELGVQLICAHSPQAKGRIERSNGVLQDRLIKEMRLAGIKTIEEANAFLPGFLESHNKRFEKLAASPEDAHKALKSKRDLEKIFARRVQRKLSKNLTFQYQGVLYLIETKTPNRLRHTAVTVFISNDKKITVECEGKVLKHKIWEERAYEQPPILDSKELAVAWVDKKQKKPSKHHPWR